MIHARPDRAQSDSKKWQKYAGQDILPMWIADADFAVDPAIVAALGARLEHDVFGYGGETEALKNAIVAHCARQYGWAIEREWIVFLPGVVPGLNFSRAVSVLRGKAAGVVSMPTYPHLFNHPALFPFTHHGVDCLLQGERFVPDFAGLDAAVDADTGLLLLCHPHNPVGRVHTDEELHAYHALAKKHDLIVCSDEIHCDLILNGTRHRPFASLDADALVRTITLMAPSKTWNIAGLCCAFAIIANEDLRRDFNRVTLGMNDVNVLGTHAALAALEHGETWREALIGTLRENAEYTHARINAMPPLRMTPVEGTYLAWIDARELPVDNAQRFFEAHGVGLNDGADYGAPGFVRLNMACDKSLLQEALARMERAIATLGAKK
ncbi:MAG: PatB family C-S lyase [Cardiobacteriaceae bacterium]|nr:PatB family C-S lyase [Cardiobacteriaceae bacterium]